MSRGPGSDSSTSASLLERAKAQDQDAWKRLLRLYSPLVCHWCREKGLQAQDATDVMQEVFRAVHRKIADFRRDRSGDTFRGWLHAITRNKLIDHFRRLSQQPELLGTWDGLLPVESYDPQEHQSDRHVLLARALDLIRAEFSEVSWEAFWRTVVDGEPTDVVAQGLGISTNAVFIVKSRILQRLRNEFQDLTD